MNKMNINRTKNTRFTMRYDNLFVNTENPFTSD